MKTKRFLPWLAITSFVCGALSIVAASTSQDPPAQTEVGGVPCQGKPQLYENGRIKTCYLSRDNTISGNLLPTGSEVFFGKAGELRQCKLGREAAFYGQTLPAKSTVFFTKEGRMRSFWLHTNTLIQGHLIKAIEDGIGNSLHPDGTLRAVWLARDEEIDGVPCTSSMNVFKMGLRVMSLGTRRMAWLYNDGHLQQGMLSRDITIQGHAFKKGDVIYLGPDGKFDLTATKLQ